MLSRISDINGEEATVDLPSRPTCYLVPAIPSGVGIECRLVLAVPSRRAVDVDVRGAADSEV